MFNFDIMGLVAGIPGLLIAIVIHEYAHARMAVRLGDDTPRFAGRLTLNPIAHIDPIGLIMLLVCRFGWAKPVPINPSNFRNWRTGDLAVALAGPGANILMAFAFLVIKVVLLKLGLMYSQNLGFVIDLIVLYNINFAIFNLIPLPPLDGSHVLMYFLPSEWAYKLMSLERYSFIILIVLLMTPVATLFFVPLQRLIWFIFSALLSIFL